MSVRGKSQFEEGLSPLAEQWPYLRFLGLGAWWAWIWLCYNSVEIVSMFPAAMRPVYVADMYLFSTMAIGCSMAIAALFWRFFTRLVDSSAAVVAAGVIAGLSTVLLAYSADTASGALFAVAAVCTGMATAALCLKVGRVYGTVSFVDSLTAGAVSLVLAALLYFVGVGAPEEWRLVYTACLPLCSALLLCTSLRDPYASAVTPAVRSLRENKPVRNLYTRLILAAAVVAMTAGVSKGIASMQMTDAQFARDGSTVVLLVGIVGVAIACVMNLQEAELKGPRRVYTALMVVGIGIMLASGFGFPISLLSVGKETLWLVFSCMMAYVAFRFELSSVRAFGIGQAVYYFASAAGWAIGMMVAPLYETSMGQMAVGVVMAFVVIIGLVYLFPEKDIKVIATVESAPVLKADALVAPAVDAPAKENAETRADDSSALDAGTAAHSSGGGISVGRAADPRYGLSQRELEIMVLFAQGRSANWIADHLVISKNTVRSHLRAIYSKLDIHTRQELLDFLDE